MNRVVIFLFFSISVGAGIGIQFHAPFTESQRLPAYNKPIEDQDGQLWFEQIQEIIKTNAVTKAEDLLPLLPESLRSRMILMHKSQSLQAADYLRPRVLLASPQARFVLSFTGDVDQAGYEAIETMRFIDSNKESKFVFEEILMLGDFQSRREYLKKSGQKRELEELEYREVRTGPNAQLCVSCHRADPRPNWDPYSTWEGAYGQFDDRPFKPEQNEIHSVTGKLQKMSDYEAPVKLLEFIEKSKSHPRYRHLIDLERKHTELEPQANSARGRIDPRHSRTTSHMNTRLTGDFVQHNARRVARMLRESEQAKINVVLFLLSLQNCGASNSKVNSFLKKPWVSFLKMANNDGTDYRLFLRMSYWFQNSSMQWEDFFMNFQRGPGNSLSSPNDDQREYPYHVAEHDPEALAFYTVQTYFLTSGQPVLEPVDDSKICSQLENLLIKRAKLK